MRRHSGESRNPVLENGHALYALYALYALSSYSHFTAGNLFLTMPACVGG
jgi:hypothetical protein